ncbi:MAG: hypothetical protein ACYTBP_02070 [Planctomycetota bacterium]
MLLNIRSFGISVAVACFFCVGVIGWIVGLSAFVCCKRAFVAAVVGYAAGVLIERVIYAIVLDRLEPKLQQEQDESQITDQQQEATESNNDRG